ncbi:VanZ family protein [Streptomyces beijiangensis]|uniref:VanZ family protein n=1 Tax=Streptomyces beijiangensis TaxID=163361 RepID=A0A939JIB0_9ACTN|nr:VanZ family protein [Streptomyces beijiangensis]
MATKELEAKPRLQRRTWGSAVARVLVLLVGFVFMVGFAVALAKVTLEPSKASVDLTHTNMRPGDSIRMYLDQPAFRDTVKQIGGNLLLGVPFGVLLPVLIPKARGLLRVVLVTAVVMFCVEAAQGLLVEGRAFDVDDVILNTLGALIGYLLLGRRLGRALHPRRTHWWQRHERAEPEPRTTPETKTTPERRAMRKPWGTNKAGTGTRATNKSRTTNKARATTKTRTTNKARPKGTVTSAARAKAAALKFKLDRRRARRPR